MSNKFAKRRPYTKEEHEIIKYFVPRIGAKELYRMGKLPGRAYDSIYRESCALGIKISDEVRAEIHRKRTNKYLKKTKEVRKLTEKEIKQNELDKVLFMAKSLLCKIPAPRDTIGKRYYGQ
jgi:hypothetical protein